MQCPRCKAEIEKGEKYCSSCGWKVKSGKKKRIIITTAVVLAVALIAGGVFYLFFGGGLFSSDNVSTLSEEQINELSNENFVMLEEGFTDVAVKDEESAIKAVASVAGKLGIENAEKELKVSAVNTVDGDTYYRMQQFYNDIPVYGKDVVLASNKKGSVILLTSNSINIEQGLNGKSIDNDFDDKKAVATLEDYFDDLYSIEDKGPYYMVLDNNSIEYTHLYTVLAAVNEEAANLEVAVSNNKYKVVFTNDLVNTDDKDYSYKVSDNKYYMFDEKRNIVMLNSKRNLSKILGNDSEKHIFNSKPLIIDGFSDKEQTYVFLNYLNNNNDEIINDISGKFSTHVYSPIEYEMSKNDKWNKDAVNFMNNVQNTYDFYKDILHRNGYNDKQGEMFVAYNDGFDGGGNAYSSGSFLCFGYKEDSSAVDLVAHEFTHSVEGSITNMVREGESGALKEAYSDIFGELAESYTNGSCDWIHGKGRNLKDPSKSKESGSTVAYPQKYKDKNWISTINKNKDHGGVHTNCTVISHAAYLMNNGIDGDENMKIGTELLAKIWYKSLQPLHPNATFEQCAATVTSAAKIMYKNGTLTQSQLGCVEEAFAEVGLGTSLIESGSSLVIYDRYQKKYDNYHITIKDAFEGKTVVDTDIKGTDTYTLDLESGTYKITVSDNTKDGSKNTFSKTISVVNSLRKIKSEVSLYTDFGVDKTAGDYVNDLWIVEFDDTVYCADKTGVWKTTDGGSNKEYISKKSPAQYIATNGKVVFFSTYEDEGDSSIYYYDKNCSVYCVNTDGTDEHKVVDTIDLAQPICVKDNLLYYNDIKDRDSIEYPTTIKYLKSYDLLTGNQKALAENAATVTSIGSKIVFRKLTFSVDDRLAVLHSYDTETGKTEDISDVSAAKMEVIDGKLYYSNTVTLEGNKSTAALYCYSPDSGKTEKLFEKSGGLSTMIQCFNSKYAYYYNNESGNYKYYRVDLKSKDTTEISGLPDGCNLAYFIGDDVYYRGYLDDVSYYLQDKEAKRINLNFGEDVVQKYCQGAFFYSTETGIKTKKWSFSESDVIEGWKDLYLTQLEGNNTYDIAALAYINDDDIPELILQSYSILPGTKMFWVNGDEIESYDIGGVAGLSYNEKEGMVRFSQFNHGISSTVIYSFDGSTVNLLHRGNDDVGNYGYDSDKVTYYWDDEKVSKSEYESNIAKYDFESHKFNSFDEMKDIIKNY